MLCLSGRACSSTKTTKPATQGRLHAHASWTKWRNQLSSVASRVISALNSLETGQPSFALLVASSNLA